MQSRWGRRLSVVLGALFLAFGTAEVIAHRNDTAAALVFWGGALLGGGAMVLVGVRTWPRSAGGGLALVVLGTVAGLVATAWTVLLPVLGVTVIVLGLRDLTGQDTGEAVGHPDGAK